MPHDSVIFMSVNSYVIYLIFTVIQAFMEYAFYRSIRSDAMYRPVYAIIYAVALLCYGFLFV